MTRSDKKKLIQFITLTGMLVNPVDDKNIVSFIHGYEFAKQKNDLTQLIKELLTDKYKIVYSSDGWNGQITRLSKKLSLSWVIVFKRIVLEIVSEDQEYLDKTVAKVLQKRILSLIGRINPEGNPCFSDSWTEEWLSLCQIKSKWFKLLWTNEEWIIVKSVDKHVQAKNIFDNKNGNIPTRQLIDLKEQYDTTKKNVT